MLKAKVNVTLKKSILDPQGSAVEKALRSMDYPVHSVRIGKFMEVTLNEESKEKATQVMDEICRKLLSNPVIEDYTFELED
ncbi:phosphoribosylformylglycinamidine synthase, purS [Syntrophobotulus glycolicus DSM 8271]|uniref:Phosphoribosylformylglycinamidine synthase subunit PurS n=1 Tax=Syntrophobotulus glycolicus (strain DSM 8271 / FlGlyR) TaxID=645991 RepID=F0SUT1_SYNGF|nr:phosphoribosylformylglycinamidine synthase subunit PurS [Syntrophobotulus glycolicus]ADY56647.1 phosphoribosylformylglycinamidine synthase, purS [Syntrophobotulus glycolicus DSM 8271]